jgi:hypothetical protein
MNNDKLKELADGLDLQTDLWWLAMILVGFLATFLAAFAYPNSGAFWAYLAVLIRLAIAVCLTQQPWGTVFNRLLALGVVAGIFSIFGDSLLVGWEKGGQRVYPDRGGLLLDSPVYLPLFWICAIVEFGYVIVRGYGLALKTFGAESALWGTMVAGGFVAAVWTACTDFWAVKAGWWHYRPGEAILGGGCALYVVIAVFFTFCAFLPLFARYLACPLGRVYASVRYGLILGGILFLSYAVAHILVEKGL